MNADQNRSLSEKICVYLQNLRLKTKPKKLRAADFSWEAPPSPVKTTISSTAIIALQLRHKRHSVPPKESNACL
jgi:hypothetical protein